MYIVDRIEEGYVVLEHEDKTMENVTLKEFPKEIKAGDLVYLEHGQYMIDEQATKERAKKISIMMDSLWED